MQNCPIVGSGTPIFLAGQQCGKTQLTLDNIVETICDGTEMESRKQTQKFLENSVYGLYSNRNFDFYDIQMMPIDYSIPSDIGIGSDQLRKLANHGKVNSWENSGYQRGVGTKDKAKFLKAVKNRRSKKK